MKFLAGRIKHHKWFEMYLENRKKPSQVKPLAETEPSISLSEARGKIISINSAS